MVKNWINIVMFIFLVRLLSFSPLAYGEIIFLKSGKKIEGEIIENTNEYIKVKFNGFSLTYYQEDIKEIQPSKPDKVLKKFPDSVNSSTHPIQQYINEVEKIVRDSEVAAAKLKIRSYEAEDIEGLQILLQEGRRLVKRAQDRLSNLNVPPQCKTAHKELFKYYQAMEKMYTPASHKRVKDIMNEAMSHMVKYTKEIILLKKKIKIDKTHKE